MGLPRPSLDLPDPAKLAALPLAHHVIDLLAVMPTARQRTAPRSPLRSGPRGALELPVRAHFDNSSLRM